MILKWKDWSNAVHLVDGIAKAVNYGQLHEAVADAISLHYDGEGPAVRYIGPDVYRDKVSDLTERGHRFEPSPETNAEGVSERFNVNDEPLQRAVITGTGPEDEAWVVSTADRSLGLCVVVTYTDGRPRETMLLDAQVAWLMSDTGATVDRFTADAGRAAFVG